ncbi:hypothetical protein ACVWXM_010014 [Bradyrhizobium sp. GM7.3]
MSDLALEKVEAGEATASEARHVISELLKEGSEKSLERLYATLGAWVWNTLESRRRDQELREWFDILRLISATLGARNTPYAERFRAFYDLLHMSINSSKLARPSKVLHRQHVVPILRLLRDTPSRQMEKAAIAKRLHLRDANLSRILRLMTNARSVRRTNNPRQICPFRPDSWRPARARKARKARNEEPRPVTRAGERDIRVGRRGKLTP